MPVADLRTNHAPTKATKPYKGIAMEGPIAKWYARVRERDQELANGGPPGEPNSSSGRADTRSRPGPGYLAIELAKLGKYQIIGLDISKSFVEIAQGKAKEAGVAIEFRHGNASDMPFDGGSFDLIICRAAFKNFTEPIQALDEMHRVLRPGGKALIIDLRRDTSCEDIKTLIDSLDLSWISTFITKWTFKVFLLKNAYTSGEIRQLVSQARFAPPEIREDTVGMEIWLEK